MSGPFPWDLPSTTGIKDYATSKDENQQVKDDGKEMVLRRFYYARKYRYPMELVWNRAYKLMRNFTDEINYPYDTPIFVPYVFVMVQTILPRLVQSMLSMSPYIPVQPRRVEFTDNAQAMQDVLEYCHYKDGFFKKMVRLFWRTLVYGDGFLKLFWKDFDRFGNIVEIPSIEDIDVFDIYLDPWCTEMGKHGDCDYLIQRVFRSWEQIKAMGELGVYSNIDKIQGETTYRPWDLYDKLRRRINVGYPPPYTDVDGLQMVELMEMWTPHRVVTIANRQHEIRNDENVYEYIPYLRLQNYFIPDEFWSLGEPEINKYQQLMLNDVRNNTQQSGFQIMNPMYLVDRFANIDPMQLVSRPSGAIFTDKIDGIKPLEPNAAVLNHGIQLEQLLKDDMDKASGVYDVTRGEPQKGEETATEILNRGQNANLRFALKTQFIEDFFSQIGEMQGDQLQMFMTQPKVDAILRNDAPKFIHATPDQIRGEFMYVPQSKDINDAKRQAERQEMAQILPVVLAPGNAQALGINLQEFFKEYISKFDLKQPQRFFQVPGTPQIVPGMPGTGAPQSPNPPQSPPQSGTPAKPKPPFQPPGAQQIGGQLNGPAFAQGTPNKVAGRFAQGA